MIIIKLNIDGKCVGGRAVHSAAAFREMALSCLACWQDAICFTRGKFWWKSGLLVYPILLFSLPLFGRSPDMTEILLTETLSLNQSIIYSVSMKS